MYVAQGSRSVGCEMHANAPSSITIALGGWVRQLTLDDMPREVVDHLKLCFLDSVGCGLFGAAQPWGRITSEVAIAMSGNGACSLFARAETVSPADAALANG